MEKIPYMLVIGEKEQQGDEVAVRHRTEGDKGMVSVEQVVGQLKEEIAARR